MYLKYGTHFNKGGEFEAQMFLFDLINTVCPLIWKVKKLTPRLLLFHPETYQK